MEGERARGNRQRSRNRIIDAAAFAVRYQFPSEAIRGVAPLLVSAGEVLAGVGLDLAFGDPRWMPHPVRGIAWLAQKSESILRTTPVPLRIAGVVFWAVVVGAITSLVYFTVRIAGSWASVYWIYSLLACRDLDVEALRVIRALNRNEIDNARHYLSRIVGRDTALLDEPEIVRATIETVAENLSDGVIAPLFYLAVGGPVAMAAYKAVNTLDSLVGYRNEPYREFGWASARIDDIANFVPARVTAALVWAAALLPSFSARRSLRVTFRDAARQPSPNSGFPEAAFAGALGVQLGGLNYYQGKPTYKAPLGDPLIPLERTQYGRTRVLLYAAEALFVIGILGWLRWR
jgi:adenosylcobinamide-phosphate synthase